MVSRYIFRDIYYTHMQFFSSGLLFKNDFLYDIAFGLMPRRFNPDDLYWNSDALIYDENMEVAEMYFI